MRPTTARRRGREGKEGRGGAEREREREREGGRERKRVSAQESERTREKESDREREKKRDRERERKSTRFLTSASRLDVLPPGGMVSGPRTSKRLAEVRKCPADKHCILDLYTMDLSAHLLSRVCCFCVLACGLLTRVFLYRLAHCRPYSSRSSRSHWKWDTDKTHVDSEITIVATTSRHHPGFDETQCDSRALIIPFPFFCSIHWHKEKLLYR